MVDHITCATCGGRIRETSDDIVLFNRYSGEKRIYHANGECRQEAQDIGVQGGAGGWNLTERPAFWCPREAVDELFNVMEEPVLEPSGLIVSEGEGVRQSYEPMLRYNECGRTLQ